MRAIVATPGGPSWTERRDVPEPEPAPNEAVVAVRAFSVNRGELALVASRGDGWQPGQDVAGEVLREAAEESDPPALPAGTRVAGLADWHGWAEQVAVPTHRLAALPDGVGFARAAALPMAGTTAANVVRLGGALLGARVLVTGASGGVGHLAVQLAALAGADVTAVARPERADAMRRYGASAVVADAAQADGPFDLVLESAGGASLAAALEHVAHAGTVVVFGSSSREPAPLEFMAFAGREAVVRAYFSGRHEAEAGRRLEILLDLAAAGRLQVEVGYEASWDRLNEAMDGLRDRRFGGKAVLTVD